MKIFRLFTLIICLNNFNGISAQVSCHPPKSNELAEHIGHGDLSSFLTDSVKWVVEKEPGRWISCYKTGKRATKKFYRKMEGKMIQNDSFIQDCLVLVLIDERGEMIKVKMALDPKSGEIYSIEFSHH